MVYIFLVVVIVFVLLIVYMWWEAHRNTLNTVDLFLDDLPEAFFETKLFFISDIHMRNINLDLLEQVKSHRPDLVLIGGDLAEKGVRLEKIEKNIKLLTEIAPTYFVWGNNDYEIDFRKLDILLRENRVNILDNTATSFESNSDRLVLIGVDDYSVGRARLDLAMKDAPSGFKILLSHNPDIVEEVSQEFNIKLVLSGHTHGGQIRLFGWGLREKGGLKYRNGIPIYISNGYGTTTLPFRLGAPSEVNLFVLKKK